MEKKVPLRKCIACRQMLPKKELLKVVKNSSGEFALDLTGKMNGRGAYICNSTDCRVKLFKNKLLNKAFSANVPTEIYEQIKQTDK